MQNADCFFLCIVSAQDILNSDFFQFVHHMFYWS